MTLSIFRATTKRRESVDSVTLDTAEVAQVRSVVAALCEQIAEVDAPDTVDAAHVLNGRLPERLLGALEDFRRFGNITGTLIVNGLPIGDLPATPLVANSVATVGTPDVAALLVTLSRLGDPISYAEEKNGALVHDVCPIPGEENEQQNTGSVYFQLHTENAFHPNLPDFLGLICLRPDPAGQARLITSSVLEAMPLISPADLDVLRQPRFRTRLAPSFCRGADIRPYLAAAPVLTGHDENLTLRVDYDDTAAIDPAAERAMDALHHALQEVRREHDLAAGSLAILDNRIVVHGRTAFTPRYDGADRWLRRTFVVSSIREALPLLPPDTNFRCEPMLGRG